MLRATLLKLVAAALVGLELWLLPDGLGLTAAVLTVLVTVLLIAYLIVSPRSQWFVRSVCQLPADGSGKGGAVAFTFDDGPDPVTTPRVLELLGRHGAKATFFVVGSRVAKHPDLVRRMLAEGHAIGSHTYDHSHAFHFLPPRSMRDEIRRGIDAVAAVTGKEPRLFRPPQGLRTPLLRDALSSLHDLVCVTWTERGLDAMGRSAPAIVRRLAGAVRPSAILTLHDGAGLGGTLDRRPTVEALGRLLEIAAERELRCVSLADLESAP